MGARDDPPQKLGSEHATAMFRPGLRELRAGFYPESNIAQPVAEYGVFGTKTPGEVAEDRRGDDRDLEDETVHVRESVLTDRLRQAEGRDGHGRDNKELEYER